MRPHDSTAVEKRSSLFAGVASHNGSAESRGAGLRTRRVLSASSLQRTCNEVGVGYAVDGPPGAHPAARRRRRSAERIAAQHVGWWTHKGDTVFEGRQPSLLRAKQLLRADTSGAVLSCRGPRAAAGTCAIEMLVCTRAHEGPIRSDLRSVLRASGTLFQTAWL